MKKLSDLTPGPSPSNGEGSWRGVKINIWGLGLSKCRGGPLCPPAGSPASPFEKGGKGDFEMNSIEQPHSAVWGDKDI